MSAVLRVGVPYLNGTAIGWPLTVAADLGFYEAEGVEVALVAGSYEELTAGVSDGSLPIIRRGPDVDIQLQEHGAPVKIIAGLLRRPISDLVVSEEITDVESLRGKTFAAIDPRLGSTLWLKTLLSHLGLRPDDYQIKVYGGSPARYEAMRVGEVAGALLSPPASYRAEHDGFRRMADVAAHVPAYVSSSIQANTEVAAEHHDAIVRYLRAVIRATEWLYAPQNRDRAIEMLASSAGMTRDETAETYAAVVPDRAYPIDGSVNMDGLAAVVDAMETFGDLEPRAGRSVDEYVDPSFAAEALAR